MLEDLLQRRRWVLPFLLFLGCCLFYSQMWPFNRENGIPWGFDLREYTYPYFDFLKAEVQERGELPLWNPHQMTGFSIVGAGEVNLFYPPNWLIYIMEVRQAAALNLFLHGFIGMWGAAMLARGVGASHTGALLAGLLWGGSGFIGARIWAGHYTLLLPVAWMVWVLAAYLWATRRGTWAAGLPGGILLAVMLISGHPQAGLIVGVALLALWLFDLNLSGSQDSDQSEDTPRFDSQRFWMLTRPLLVMGVSGLILGAVAWLPIVETTLASGRNSEEQDTFAFADTYSLPANQVLTFLFPGWTGYRVRGFGDANFEELFAYAGLLPLIGAAVLLRRPGREVWRLVFLAGLGLLLSLAMDGGLLRLMIQAVPPFGLFRSAGRWLILTQLALACLAGLFITWIQGSTREERETLLREFVRRWLPASIVLLFLLAFFLSLGRTLNAEWVNRGQWWYAAGTVSEAGLFLLLFLLILLAARASRRVSTGLLILLLGLGVVEAWRISLPLIFVGQEQTYAPLWGELESLLPPEEAGNSRIYVDPALTQTYNSATGRGYYDVSGYESLSSDDYTQWLTYTSDFTNLSGRLLGIRYLMRPNPAPPEFTEGSNPRLRLLGQGSNFFLYEMRRPIPRVFFAEMILVDPNDGNVNFYFTRGQDARPDVAIVDEADICLQGDNLPGGRAAISEYTPNRVELAVQARGAGVLILADRFAPGWQATVNGESVPIYRANTIFRAVCVPAGRSEVVFTYAPISLYIGVGLSLLGFAGVLIWGVLRVIRRRRAADAP